MMRPYLLRRLIPFGLVVLLLPACSDSADEAVDTTVTSATTTEAATTTTTEAATTATEATTSTASATTEVVRTPLQLTFNGEHCVYEGPVKLATGHVKFTYVNESEDEAWVAFNRHTGDETIQDAIDHFGDSPSSTPCPSWKRDVVRTMVQPGDAFQWAGDLEAATYHMVCYRQSPLSVWFGTAPTVEG